ncbi:MAG: LysM peptidoglycan-binding domain-containing protein [Anaerolineales bacterium]|nr:LysM peptidoglycan-binding domain-containing protein [Anaerolineales bacterium]
MNLDQEEVRTFVRENQQIILPLVIIALLLFVYIIVVLAVLLPRWRQRTELTAASATVEAVYADRTTQQNDVAGQISQQVETAQAAFDGQVNYFLTETQAAAFLDNLYTTAAATAVSIVDLQAQALPSGSFAVGEKPAYDVRQFHLVAAGEIAALNTFVGHLKQTAVASIRLQNLLVTAGEPGSPGSLSVDLLLYTSPFSSGESVAELPGAVAAPLVTAVPSPVPLPTAAATPVPDISGLSAQLDAAWAAEDWPEAIRLIQQIRQQAPTEPDMTEKLYAARVNFGYQLAGLGETAAAAEQFEQALAIFPEGVEAEAGLQSLFAPTPTPTPETVIYVVQRGDTLYSIARRYGATVDAVKAANGLASNNISPGQQLIIP